MNFSYWEQQSFLNHTDVAIIGSGIVGLNAAIQLKAQRPQATVRVFERGILPSGASTKNAGFACFGSATELLSDLKKYTENEVFALVEKRWRGLHKLRSLLGDGAIQYENLGGYELFDSTEAFEACAQHLDNLNRHLVNSIGKNVYSIADQHIETFGFRNIKHLIFNAYEGQLHTGQMMKTLLQLARKIDVEVWNGVPIAAIHQTSSGADLVLDSGGVFRSQQTLVTTNGFARQLLPELDVTPGRGQVLVTKPIPNLRLKGTFHYNEGYYYFRNIDGRVLLGGGRNIDFEAEATTEFGFTDVVQNQLNHLLQEVILPHQPYEIESRWSGIMGFGTQQAPIVRQISDNIFCAVKMQGMGVAIGSLVGQEAAAMLLAHDV